MRSILGLSLLIVSSLVGLPVQAQSGALEQARGLIASGEFVQAFEILEPLEFNLAGNKDFDLMFALSALETGRAGLAMLALERVLTLDADSKAARFLLARAQVALGDLDGARREFELLLSLNPGARVGNSVNQFLDAIAAGRPDEDANWSGYLELGSGHDTNVTGGNASDLIFVSGLNQDILLGDGDVEEDDAYANLAGGLTYVNRFARRHAAYAGADLATRAHREIDELDYAYAALRTGYRYRWRNQSLRLGLASNRYRLDDEPYRDGDQYEVEWSNTFARRRQISLSGWKTRYRFRQAVDETLNYDDLRLRAAHTWLLGTGGDKLVSIAFDVGHQDDRNGREDGNQDYAGFQLSYEIAFDDSLVGLVLVGAETQEYERFNPFFNDERSDSQYRFTVGLNWLFAEDTSLRATLSHDETNSNFELYDSSSTDFSLRLRRDF